MTEAMHNVCYGRLSLNEDARALRHPLWVSERHFVFLLERDVSGNLAFRCDRQGSPIRCPRKLANVCVYTLVQQPAIVVESGDLLPATSYLPLLREAILQRQTDVIRWLVSSWPFQTLNVLECAPLEEYLDNDYLTTMLDDGDNCRSLLDCIILGLLQLQSRSQLRFVDLSWFGHDRRICKEALRLPVLWMHPDERTSERQHLFLSQFLPEMDKDKLGQYFERITCIYASFDKEIEHMRSIPSILIHLDLFTNFEDVAIGTILQHQTPFRFQTNKIWQQKSDGPVFLPIWNWEYILDLRYVVCLEYHSAEICHDRVLLFKFVSALLALPRLRSLSLPNTIDVSSEIAVCKVLNRVLIRMKQIRRLDFAYSNLKNQLAILLGSVSRPIEFIGLKDCRLSLSDISFLSQWRPLSDVKELNLSCNTLSGAGEPLCQVLASAPKLVCLSVSYTQLSEEMQLKIISECKGMDGLKSLALQNFVPPGQDHLRQMLQACIDIRQLQQLLIFPRTYAFPGDNDEQRRLLKTSSLTLAYQVLQLQGRNDLLIL